MALANLSLLAAEGGGGEQGAWNEIVQRFSDGGWGMYPIAVCLVVAIAIMVERVLVLFMSASINKDGFIRGLKKHIYAGDLDKAINYVAG